MSQLDEIISELEDALVSADNAVSTAESLWGDKDPKYYTILGIWAAIDNALKDLHQ